MEFDDGLLGENGICLYMEIFHFPIPFILTSSVNVFSWLTLSWLLNQPTRFLHRRTRIVGFPSSMELDLF